MPGDQAVARFVPVDPAVGSRTDDGSVGLGADGERRHERRHRGGGAARGAAGGVLGVVRIPGLARRVDRKLGGDGLSQEDRARLAELRDGGRIFRRPSPGVENRAVLGRHVLRVEDILDPHRDAVERTERLPFPPRQVRRARLVQGMGGVQVRPRADPLLERRDAIETGAYQRFGGDPAGANRLGRLDGAQESRIRLRFHAGHGGARPHLAIPYVRSGSHVTMTGKT